uniref:Uncharacterized protein n=1 Tax=Fagus sylvatica TaxID=28930 RepID=A0A2N9GJ03_FAGSY
MLPSQFSRLTSSPHGLMPSRPQPHGLTPFLTPSLHFSDLTSLSLSLNFVPSCPSLPRSHRRLKAQSHTAGAPKPSISPSPSLKLSDLSTPPIGDNYVV